MRIPRDDKDNRSTITLPKRLTEGATLLQRLRRRGVLDEVAKRLHVARRAGGFVGVDAVVLLLLAFTRTVFFGGMRGFREDIAEFSVPMGCLAGRVSLMASSTLAGFLRAVKLTDLTDFTQWFLLHGSGVVDALLRDPIYLPRDAQRQPWQVFWYDPTREAYRQRRLGEDPSAPPPSRKAARLSRRGHRGRKRGEFVNTVGMLQHVSGAWIDVTLEPGNGSPREQFASALSGVVRACAHVDHPLSRSMIVCDGEFGDVPSLDAAQRARVPLITRCSRYKLLEDPAILAQLARATWRPVPSGGTGPQRWACDLGMVQFPPAESTKRSNGEPYEPVTVRVVVSRRADDGRIGKLIGGQRIELFVASDLPEDQWPPEHVVATFFARSAIENSFAQIDAELEMDRTVSHEPGGQLLAIVCCAFVWNDRLVRGARSRPPPRKTHEPHPVPPATPPPPLDVGPLPSPPDPPGPSPDAVTTTSPTTEIQPAPGDLDSALDACEIQKRVEERGWTWDPALRMLTDDKGEKFRLSFVTISEKESSVRFASVSSRRTKGMSLPSENAASLRTALETWRLGDRVDGQPPRRPAIALIQVAGERPTSTVAPAWPLFNAHASRALATQEQRERTARVTIRRKPVIAEETSDVFHSSIGRRRRTRMTWIEQTAILSSAATATVTSRKSLSSRNNVI